MLKQNKRFGLTGQHNLPDRLVLAVGNTAAQGVVEAIVAAVQAIE